MLVETYEVEEVTNEAATLAADSEAADLIAKLELEGQKKLLNPETVTRFPYRKMTKEERNVYLLLCPQRTKVEDYADGLIPLRVLQVAAHAKDLDFCRCIEVWHPENGDIKDPVLVGVKGPEHGDQELFLLARWGEELLPFAELRKIALEAWREKRKSVLEGIAREVEMALSKVGSAVGFGQMPYLYDFGG